MKFYFVHIVKVSFVLKTLIVLPLYVHKTLPILGSEKYNAKSNFTKISSAQVSFFKATKTLKMFFFTCPIGQLLQK